MIGMDSSALIDLFKDNLELKNLLKNIDEPLVLNQISYLELMFGINFENSNHKREEYYYDELFQSLIVFDLDNFSSKKAAEIFQNLKKKGLIIDHMDCIIAGIFLINGVNKIITKNVKHFENILGLKVISY